jgi:hypothetical protein
MRAREFITETTEIEFVCVNKDVLGSTSPAAQRKLINALKNVPGIIIYTQDFDDDEDQFSGGKSLSVLLHNESTEAEVLRLAQEVGVEVDVIQDRSEDFIRRVKNDPATTSWYETSLDEMARSSRGLKNESK